MSPEVLFGELRTRVVGRPVSSRRLAGNSLLVYIDGEPGSKTGVTFWLEPTWHLRGPERVVTGSREAQHDEDAEDPNAGFRRAAEAVDALVGRTLTDVRIEPVTGDLHIELEGGFLLRTFVSDPTNDHFWHVRDNVSGVALYRSADGFAIQARADA
jgi:hypothetical protein